MKASDPDNLSNNFLLPSPSEKNDESGNGTTFIGHNITVGEAAQLSHTVVCDKGLAEEETGIQAAPAIYSRQAEPVEAERDLIERAANLEIAKASVCNGALSFTDWVDRFLSIPLGEFRSIDQKVMEKIYSSYQINIVKTDDKKVANFLKFKMLLNRVIYEWQKSHGSEQIKEQTKAKLVSLCVYTQSESVFSGCLKYLVLLKVYRDSLYGKPISDNDRQLILEVLNSRFINGNNEYNTATVLFVDFYSLQIFYYFGALPGFEDGVNYKKAFDLLVNNHSFSYDIYNLFSPVSFTIFDSVRFLTGSLALIQDHQKELNLTSTLGGMLRMIIMEYLFQTQLEKELYLNWLYSVRGFDLKKYLLVCRIVGEFADSIYSLHSDETTRKDVNRFKCIFASVKELASNAVKSHFLADCVGLITYMRVQIVLHDAMVRTNHSRYALAGRLYSEIAQQNPNHWGTVYSYYHQAGKWESAACAADYYSCYWKDKSRVLREYWSDVSYRERDLCRDTDGRGASVSPEEHYDIDAAMKGFPTMAVASEVTTKAKHRKRHPRKGFSVPVSQTFNNSKVNGRTYQQHQSAEEVKGPSCFLAPTGHRQERSVIRSIPKVANGPSELPDDEVYRIKSAKGSIQSFEKLLSSHWNPRVWAVLTAVRKARGNLNIDEEREIYQQVLDNPALKTCVGIERVWEERAWTELHQFDDFFRVGVLTCGMKDEAKKWIKNARELYILPSLAHFMNLDKINTDIDPEVVWARAMSLLAQPELAPVDINQEIRFRLRCLFSSMGHTYSLSAMVNSRHSNHLRQTANAWYGLKAIDPNYVAHSSRSFQVVGKHDK